MKNYLLVFIFVKNTLIYNNNNAIMIITYHRSQDKGTCCQKLYQFWLPIFHYGDACIHIYPKKKIEGKNNEETSSH